MSRARDLGDVGSKANFLDNVSTNLGDFSGQSIPHIIPGILHPAVEGKDLAGVAFSGSYVYGTAHTDGRKYYYTDIKGSRPIHDPRVGSVFGSQRHMFSSVQLLEQETATHGFNVHSVDGREWIRRVGNDWSDVNNNAGVWFFVSDSATENSNFFEITGYFNAVNWLALSDTSNDVNISIDGVANTSTFTGGTPSVNSPLSGRFVNSQSVVALTFDSTPNLGIHTVKLSNENGDYMRTFGIELIAQDTTSTANRSKIQIPSQNVVSYGKKFNVSGTPHYDPFSAKTDGSAWTSPTSGTNNANSSASWPTNIDTATSLGLDKWVDGSNYYRPYNGARVVHWVDSSGTIKTSVTVMPPNAKSIKSADINKKAKNAPNDTYLPTFEDETTDINEDNLHEVAKTFMWREFGNGNANGGSAGNYKDATMLQDYSGGTPDIAYVMDDGTTSLSGDDVYHWQNQDMLQLNTKYYYITFIGTGISVKANTSGYGTRHLAQNLPFGSHILRAKRHDSQTFDSQYDIDGVAINGHASQYPGLGEVTFYQPKRPPIPEEAVIISDYCLMADFVSANTSHDNGRICKGVRRNNSTRDHFYDTSASFSTNVTLNFTYGQEFGFWARQTGGATGSVKLPFFGTRFICILDGQHQSNTLTIDGGSDTYNSGTIKLDNATTTNLDGVISPAQTLGIHNFTLTQPSGGYTYAGTDIATPIHTSHHYQTFESEFLQHLIGGDRNMEQTNLVCTPDGRSWDQLTRNTSYLGPRTKMLVGESGSDTGYFSGFTDHRGEFGPLNLSAKNIAWGWDRIIILEDGYYDILLTYIASTTATYPRIYINSTSDVNSRVYAHQSHLDSGTIMGKFNLKRGDYIYLDKGPGGNLYGQNTESGARIFVTKIE